MGQTQAWISICGRTLWSIGTSQLILWILNSARGGFIASRATLSVETLPRELMTLCPSMLLAMSGRASLIGQELAEGPKRTT